MQRLEGMAEEWENTMKHGGDWQLLFKDDGGSIVSSTTVLTGLEFSFLIRVWFTPWQRMCLYGGRMVEVKDPEWEEWKFDHRARWLMEECMGWTWCRSENKENKITLSIITHKATSNHDSHEVPKIIPRDPSFLQLFCFVFLNLSLGN